MSQTPPPTDLRRRLLTRVPLTGVHAPVPSDRVIDLAGRAGMDLVVLDAANGIDEHVLRRHVLVARAHGMATLVRVGTAADAPGARAAGASGVILPEADAVTGNDRTGLLLVVEAIAATRAAVRAACDVPNVDAVLVAAPSATPHVPADALDAARRAGVPVLVSCPTRSSAHDAMASGVNAVLCPVENMIEHALTTFASTGNTHLLRAGGVGEPLVFLPGMLGTAETWGSVAARLTDVADPRIGRIDLDDSIQEMAATVLAEAPPRFALAGHSLGGIVALEVLRRAPHRVTRLALCNTTGRDASPAQQEAWSGLAVRSRQGDFRDLAQELATANLPDHRRGDGALVQAGARMALDVGPDGLRRQLAAQATRPDNRPFLADVRVPTLVLSGSRDEVCPIALQEELVAGIPDALHVVVDDAGHMAPMEEPRAVEGHLRAWLASAAPRPS